MSGISKRQMWPATCSGHYSFTGTQSQALCYMLSVYATMAELSSGTETEQPAKPKIFIWPFTEKSANP